ncbi:MAG: 30S ribosomal protein S20 [Pelagibacterales bacterium]|nr:30S ribosomal protein S20 [Pelagibacterales bacterium]
MANNKSAMKRIKTSNRNKLQNKFYKTSIKTLIKLFSKHIKIYTVSQKPEEKEQLKTILNMLYSLIDKAYKKNIFHKNKAARKKAQLALKLKSINF